MIPPPDYSDPRVQAAMKRVYEAVRACVQESSDIVSLGCAARNALGVHACHVSGAVYLQEQSTIEGDKRICPHCGEPREVV